MIFVHWAAGRGSTTEDHKARLSRCTGERNLGHGWAAVCLLLLHIRIPRPRL